MKQELDREIDALLRRRHGAAAQHAPEQEAGDVARSIAGQPRPAQASRRVATPHLDADALSAYAENALPAAARALYVPHLADCDECRSRVVELTRALDVAGELDRRAAQVPAREASSWRAWLSALFAPRTLRLVAPLVAVCFVGIVAFIVMRSNPEGPSVARQAERESSTQTSDKQSQPEGLNQTAGVNPTGTNSTVAPTSGATGATNSTSATSAETKQDNVKAMGEASAGEAPVPSSPAIVQKENSSGAAGTSAGPGLSDRTGFAAGVTMPAPTPRRDNPAAAQPESAPVAEDEVLAVNTQTQNRQLDSVQQMRRAQVQAPDGGRAETRSANNTLNSAAGGAAAPPAASTAARAEEASAERRTRAAKPRSRAADEEAKSDSDEAGETRSVAGHRFRRQGAAWIDVNYRQSMSMTGVSRGTEAYRALVADLPEVGRIAASLGGEVIVVIKGRAYRVH